jgi:peptidoglycan glycosyltransferase
MVSLGENQPQAWLDTMSSSDASQISELMVNNVTNGYAHFAFIDGVEVGGKTGTAQTDEDSAHSWFTGFAPADNPQFAIAVLVEEAEANAGNLAAEILRVALGI